MDLLALKITGHDVKEINKVKLFLTLKDKQDGYAKTNVTPYIHLLVYHVPKHLSDNNGMNIFTGQGVGKTNDVVQSIYHKKRNKLDSCKDSLLALKRLDYLADQKRKASSYTKHNDQYWKTTIFEKRRKLLEDKVYTVINILYSVVFKNMLSAI